MPPFSTYYTRFVLAKNAETRLVATRVLWRELYEQGDSTGEMGDMERLPPWLGISMAIKIYIKYSAEVQAPT